MPEKVAKPVLDLLNIKNDLKNIETFHIGSAYHAGSLSVIPNHVMPKTFAPQQPVNILANEHFDEVNIAKWAYSRKSKYFLDQPMQYNYLQAIRDNVHQINYYIKLMTMKTFLNYNTKNGNKTKINLRRRKLY